MKPARLHPAVGIKDFAIPMAVDGEGRIVPEESPFLVVPREGTADEGCRGLKCLSKHDRQSDAIAEARDRLHELIADECAMDVSYGSDGSIIASAARKITNEARALGDLEGFQRGVRVMVALFEQDFESCAAFNLKPPTMESEKGVA